MNDVHIRYEFVSSNQPFKNETRLKHDHNCNYWSVVKTTVDHPSVNLSFIINDFTILLLTIFSPDPSSNSSLLSSDHLSQFPLVFSMSLGLVKLIQGFWHLDSGDFHQAIACFQSPFARPHLLHWHHQLVLKALLFQGKWKFIRMFQRIKWNRQNDRNVFEHMIKFGSFHSETVLT